MSTATALKPFLVEKSEYFTCHYKNETDKLQVIRISNLPNTYFERVVFPGQQLIFNAIAAAVLEVYSSEIATAMLVDRIFCERLRCVEIDSKCG